MATIEDLSKRLEAESLGHQNVSRLLRQERARYRRLESKLLDLLDCVKENEIHFSELGWDKACDEARLRIEKLIADSNMRKQNAGQPMFTRDQVMPLVTCIREVVHGEYTNAHDCMFAAKHARPTLEHARALGLL